MYNLRFSKLTFYCCIFLFISSCGKEGCKDPSAINYDPEVKKNNSSECIYADFDRKGMLENLSRNYITPGLEAYNLSVDSLVESTQDFINSTNNNSLDNLRKSWKNSLMAWQEISFIGPSKYLTETDIESTNIFPADTNIIDSNITNSLLPLSIDEKGYQAIDFLINMSDDNNDILDYFTMNNYAKDYLSLVVEEIQEIATNAKTKWYNDTTNFINNNSNTANGTSISIISNALNKHYEYYIRRGKFGLPLNIYDAFADDNVVFPDKVECYYYGQSLPFAKKAVESVKNFLNGCQFRNSEENGLGFDDYADLVNAKYGSTSLSTAINNQFDNALNSIDLISDPLSNELTTNRIGVQDVYDDLQQLVILIKNDLTSSALGIQITYADNDGD
jgi:predicted lipoprotein